MPRDGADRQASPGPFGDAAGDQPRDPDRLDRPTEAAAEHRAAAGPKPYTTEHETYAAEAVKAPDHPDQRAAARTGTPIDPNAISQDTPADPAFDGTEEKAP